MCVEIIFIRGAIILLHSLLHAYMVVAVIAADNVGKTELIGDRV